MEKAKHTVRFEAEVDASGRVNFSAPVYGLLVTPGTKVTVKIFGGVLSPTLERLNVTEEEIERIGSVQLEDREHVVAFLSSHGALKKNAGFRRRIERMVR